MNISRSDSNVDSDSKVYISPCDIREDEDRKHAMDKFHVNKDRWQLNPGMLFLTCEYKNRILNQRLSHVIKNISDFTSETTPIINLIVRFSIKWTQSLCFSLKYIYITKCIISRSFSTEINIAKEHVE